MSNRKGELYRGQYGGENPSEDFEHTLGMEKGTYYEYYEDSESGDDAERLTVNTRNAKYEANMDLMPGFQGPTTSTELFEFTPAHLEFWGSSAPYDLGFRLRGVEAIERDIGKNQHRMMLHLEDMGISRDTNPHMEGEREYARGLASRGTWQHVPIHDPALFEQPPELWKILGESSPHEWISKQQFQLQLPGMEDS